MVGPPRPPLKPTAGRSPQPQTPQTQPSSSRPMGKIVRIPRTSTAASASTARPIVSTTTASAKRISQRTRPAISPPRDSSTLPESSSDPTTTTMTKRSRSPFGSRILSSNPTPPPPQKISTPHTPWKRRRSTPSEADLPPVVPVPVPAAAAQSKAQEPDMVPEQVIAPSEDPKPSDQEATAAIEEEEVGDLEETEFERAIVEWEEAMTKSTAWVGEAFGSILGDLTKLAALTENRVKLGELIRVSVREMLEPAAKHAEVIGDLGKGLDDAIRRIR